MSNGRISMKSIFDNLYAGHPLTPEDHRHLAEWVDEDNVEQVAWDLVFMGKGGWNALKNLWFNTGSREVKDCVYEVISEKQAEPAAVQIDRMQGHYPVSRRAYRMTSLDGLGRLNTCYGRVFRKERPDFAVA